MSHPGQRIKELRIASQQELADVGKACGVSASAVHQWESGATKSIRPTHLLSVARHFNVNLVWLITGAGPQDLVVATNDHEIELLKAFRKLSEGGQLAMLSHLEWMLEQRPGEITEPPPKVPRRFQ